MSDFWQSDTYRIVRKMQASGNMPGIVQLWAQHVYWWAKGARGPDADAVLAWFPQWQIRDLYTAAELSPIFPVLAVALGLRERPEAQKSPFRLANELKMAMLPHRIIDLTRPGQGLGNSGQTFFAVARLHHWAAADDTEWQKEISNVRD